MIWEHAAPMVSPASNSTAPILPWFAASTTRLRQHWLVYGSSLNLAKSDEDEENCLCSLVQIQAFWNEREESPWRSLTKPRKLSFPSECLIQSWRTTWTGTDGLSPSSWEKSRIKLVVWSIWRETCFLVLSTMFGCWEVEKCLNEKPMWVSSRAINKNSLL